MPTFLLVLIIFLLPWYYYVQIFARLAPQPTQVGVFRGDPPGEDLTTTLKEKAAIAEATELEVTSYNPGSRTPVLNTTVI